MSFFSCFIPYSPLGKAFTMSLQTHSTHISKWHVLPILNQSSPAYWFTLYGHNFQLLLACKVLLTLMWKIYMHTYMHANMHTHTLFGKQFQ